MIPLLAASDWNMATSVIHYCNETPDTSVYDDILKGTVPESALLRRCCWKRICEVWSDHYRSPKEEIWRLLCARRGLLLKDAKSS